MMQNIIKQYNKKTILNNMINTVKTSITNTTIIIFSDLGMGSQKSMKKNKNYTSIYMHGGKRNKNKNKKWKPF